MLEQEEARSTVERSKKQGAAGGNGYLPAQHPALPVASQKGWTWTKCNLQGTQGKVRLEASRKVFDWG